MKNDENWDGELRHLFVFDWAMLLLWFCVQPLQGGACVLSPERQSWCCWSVESHAVSACLTCVFIKHGSTKLGLHASDHTLVCLFININYQRFVCFFIYQYKQSIFCLLESCGVSKEYLKAREESSESLQAFGICVWLWCYFTLYMMQRHKSTFQTIATEYLCTVFWIKLEHRPSTPFLFKYKFAIINESKKAKEW